MNFNNNEIKGGAFVPMEPGIYRVTVWDHKFDTVNDKDVVRIQFKRKSDGMIHSETFYLQDNSLWKIKALSIACRISTDATWEIQDIMGKDLRISIIKKTFRGEDRTEIKIFQVDDPDWIDVQSEPKDGVTEIYHEESGDKVVEGSKADPF